MCTLCRELLHLLRLQATWLPPRTRRCVLTAKRPASPRCPCSFIRASRPDAAAGAYRLATAFPPQELDDDGATIGA